MDYLYDKVELYDSLKYILHGHGNTDNIVNIQNGLADIEHHMLHFLENHDEHRLASPEFAGDPRKAAPAMVISATISTSPTMIYFGQEVGEMAAENAGFGSHGRTTIFDYFGVPAHQRWMNEGKFDGGQLTQREKELRDFYQRLLNFTRISTALTGEYRETHTVNRQCTSGYDKGLFSFVRWSETEKILIINNFDTNQTSVFNLMIPDYIIQAWNLRDGSYLLFDQLYKQQKAELKVMQGVGNVQIIISPLQSFIYKLE